MGREQQSCSVFLFKQKTAYEMRISDWSSDVCSSDLRWQYGCAVAWFVMLRDIHLIGALIPPRRPHPRCRRPAALAHLAVILDRAKRRSGLLKPFARGPDGMSQHSPITLRFCQSSAKLETKA